MPQSPRTEPMGQTRTKKRLGIGLGRSEESRQTLLLPVNAYSLLLPWHRGCRKGLSFFSVGTIFRATHAKQLAGAKTLAGRAGEPIN